MHRFPTEPIEPILDALDHPIRAQVLEVLTSRNATATELAEIIGEPASKIRYHLRALAKSGLIGCEQMKERRGARENVWLSRTPQVVEDEQVSEMTPEQIRLLTLYSLRLIFSDAAAGLREGAFVRRPDACLVRFRPEVDEQGWRELVELVRSNLTGIEGVVERATERLEESDEDPFVVSASILLFDLKPPARPLPGISSPKPTGDQ